MINYGIVLKLMVIATVVGGCMVVRSDEATNGSLPAKSTTVANEDSSRLNGSINVDISLSIVPEEIVSDTAEALTSTPVTTTLGTLLPGADEADSVEQTDPTELSFSFEANRDSEEPRVLKPLEEIIGQLPWIGLFVFMAFVIIALSQKQLPKLAEAEHTPGWLRLPLLLSAPFLRLFIIIGLILGIVPLIIEPTEQNFAAVVLAVVGTIGFALKDYFACIFAGTVALTERPYHLKDWISVDNYYGRVEKMGLWSVQIVTPDDTVVTIPHAKIWDTSIANANAGETTHMCVADLYVQPAHDAQSVRAKLWEVCVTSPYTCLDKPVKVTVTEKPWGTQYRLKAYPIDGSEEFQFISDLTVRGKAALAELNVEPAVAPAVALD